MKKLIVLLLTLTIPLVFTSCKNPPQETTSATERTSSTSTGVSSEPANVEKTSSAPTSAASSKSVSSEQAPITSEPTPTASTVTSSEETDDSTSSSTTTNTTATSSAETRKVVQIADPETGISWDGVSPIIYTYTDGTTGTEKRDGATYESVPGMIATINLAFEESTSDYDGNCEHCGKKGGDGTNGTCLRYFGGGDHTCAHCGDTVPVKTCHTCKQ